MTSVEFFVHDLQTSTQFKEMSRAARVIQRLNTFCDDNFPAATTTRDDVLAHFNVLDELILPFPSNLLSQRFQLIDGTNNFCYFGREMFQQVVTEMGRDLMCLRVIGTAGGGKSHTLAAYATYLYCMSRRFPDDPRVVYISSCGAAGATLILQMVIALQVALPDDVALRDIDMQGDDDDLKQGISAAMSRNSARQFVFIYDDWNYILGKANQGPLSEADRNALGTWMIKLAGNHVRIEAISANEMHSLKGSFAEKAPVLVAPSGLSDDEWAVWRASPRLALFNGLEDDTAVRHFTGLIPIFLTSLCTFGAPDFEEAMNRFNRSQSSTPLSGRELVAAMTKFCDSIPDEKLRAFVRTMRNAMGGVQQDDLELGLYDSRYFVYDDASGVLSPINGYISRAMVEILSRSVRIRRLLFEELDLPWVLAAMKGPNPIIGGFAMEMYEVAQFILSHDLSVEQVVRFAGNYPSFHQLKTGTGLVLYWPCKWNLRSVDYVTRDRVEQRVQVGRGRRKELRVSVTINAYQVTAQTPVAHAHTRNFYETDRAHTVTDAMQFPLPDCRRYELLDEQVPNIVHRLTWVLPSSLTAAQRARIPTIRVQSLNNLVVPQNVSFIHCD